MTSRDQWKALAARCAEAKGPDREIDWLILQATGWRRVKEGHPFGRVVYDDDRRANQILPDLTASLDAIVSLIEKTLPGTRVYIVTGDNYSHVRLSRGYGARQVWFPIPDERADDEAALSASEAYCVARAELAKEGETK